MYSSLTGTPTSCCDQRLVADRTQGAEPLPDALVAGSSRGLRREVAVSRREKADRKEAAAVSALDLIAEAAGPGPLHMLKGAYDTGGRVRIVTRHARGVRGTATGAWPTALPPPRTLIFAVAASQSQAPLA